MPLISKECINFKFAQIGLNRLYTFHPRGNCFCTALFQIYTMVQIFKLMQILQTSSENALFNML